jgi:beta-N-acetylhexosaminidase
MPPASSSVPDAAPVRPAAGAARPLAVLFGCAGEELDPAEAAFFRDADPMGFILFRRNAREPSQVAALAAALREAVGRLDAPVLVDQEGGRVQRLRGPAWPPVPPMRAIGALAERDPAAGAEAARLAGLVLAATLRPIGIDVDCAPVADVLRPETTDAIGDRAFSADPDLVAELCRRLAAGLLEGGVLPVAKHMPGHGRAVVDSHLETPRVHAPREALEETDFAPFRALQALPCGMVAHVVYDALDPVRPASVSPSVIGTLVRREFGFDGFLFSDDVCMEALGGTPAERACAVLAAGCDAALHCNGEMAEMEAIAARAPRLTEAAAARWARARAYPAAAPAPFDPDEGLRRLGVLLAGSRADG